MNNNFTILNSITNTKLQLSSVSNVPLGTGLKTFQVNPIPMAEIHTGNVLVTTSGSKYLTGNSGDQIVLSAFRILTNTTAKLWEVNTNTAGFKVKVGITGVDANNNEIYEEVETSGNTAVNTTNSFKMVNDMNIISGGTITTQIIFCRPQGGTPQDQRVQISGTFKYNPFFMCSNKNGLTRKARLRSINTLTLTGANSNIALHVFNNNVSLGDNTFNNNVSFGIFNLKYRLYNVSTSSSVYGLTFSDDGVVELLPGELAVFYRENASTMITSINFTWSYYYTS